MSPRANRFRPAALAAVLAFASLLSCGREVTGPGGAGRRVELQFNPVFQTVRLGGDGRVLSIGDVVDFARVRVLVLRANGDTAIDRLVEFPPDSTTVRLSVPITLSQAATSEGEPLEATLKYLNATGDTVFTGGPATVIAKSSGGSNTPPPDIPVRYTGSGANAASITIAPPSLTGVINQQATFTATVRDSGNAVMGNVPVAFTSTDSNRVSVNLRTGAAVLIGARGTARIIAQTLTGQADTSDVDITPTASTILLVSGGSQSVRQGEPFPLPVRVRVNAADNLPLAGVPVSFVVTRGQGSAAPGLDTTDANGFAEATWTAGDSVGIGNLTATVVGRPLTVVVPGTQLSSSPSALTFSNQPVNFTAGDTIAPLVIVVRDATADTVSNFTGDVTLALIDGTAGANLLGTTTRAAVNGVATFPFLTIDRAGTAYRLRATVTGVPPQLSTTFNVAAAPPRYVTIIAGANQTAPALTVLPDSVRARVTNTFGAPVSGVAVSWAVVSGGGTITPANATSDSLGRVSAQWTIGAAGAQQARALVTGLPAALVNASVFTPTGTPTLFAGLDGLSMTIAASRTVPIYLNPADVVPVVATLTMRDTLIADWVQDSVIFSPGSTLRSPTVTSRAAGSTWAVITSVRGTDSVQVSVAQASVQLSGDFNNSFLLGDTLRKTVRLSAPAPVGGVQIRIVTSDPSIMQVAPTSGRGAPSDRCYDYYCNDDGDPSVVPVSGATGSILLAPPSDTIIVTIPEGQAMSFFAVVPRGVGDASINATALNHASDTRNYNVAAAELFLYNYYGTQIHVGAQSQLDASIGQRMTRDVIMRFRSTDDEVIQVDSTRRVRAQDYYTYNVRPRGVGVGSAYLVVEADGFTADSILLDVVAPHMWIDNRTPFLAIGQNHQLEISTANDEFGSYAAYWARANALPMTVTSSDTSVVDVTFSGQIAAGETYGESIIRARAPGSAWVRVAAAGHGIDSVLVVVQSTSLYIYDNSFRVGVGQLHNSTTISLNYAVSSVGGDLQRLDIASSDPSVAMVLTPTQYARAGDYFTAPTILGVNPGTVTLTFSGPGIDSTTRTFTVAQPRLDMGNVGGTGGTFDADSSSLSLTSYASDDLGTLRPVADTVHAVLRSTNPAVVLVTDSLVLFTPGNYYSYNGTVRLLSPGTARLVLSAPGYAPDTSPVITLRPPRLDITSATLAAGRGLAYEVGFFRRSPNGTPLQFTVSTSGPADLNLVQTTDTIAAGTNFDRFYFRTGAALGTDTVIISAPGHAPDTLRVTVSASTARPVLVSSALIGDDIEVSGRLERSGLSGTRAPADTTTLRITTSDTALVDVLEDTIRIAPDSFGIAFRTATIRFRRPGSARIRITDPTGLFAPDSLLVTGRLRTLYGGSEVDMGPRQTTSGTELYVYRDSDLSDSVWVRLSSSAPTIARPVQDSVLMLPDEYYAYFNVASGDSVGGAIITASADGFAQMQHFVGVTRGVVTLYLNDDIERGDSTFAEAYLTSARSYQSRPTLEAVPVRLRSDDPTIASIGGDSLRTIPIGEYVSTTPFGPVHGVALGSTTIRIEDTRTSSFRQYEPGIEELEVRPRRMRFNAASYSVGIGLESDISFLDFDTPRADGHWVQLRSLSGRFSTVTDSAYRAPGSSNVYVPLIGISAGVDTLVATAPGYSPDTAIINVGPGAMRVYWPNPVLASGDSVLVTVEFVAPGDTYSVIANGTRTLTFSVTGPALIVAPGTTVPTSTIVVNPGEYMMTFWVKATGGGSADLTISAPGLLDARVRVRTTTGPGI